MQSERIVHLNRVKKSYGEMKALSPLSLVINRGETVALIGPSGAGKSTLLNILANIVVPDSGEVVVNEISLDKYSNKRFAKTVGIMRQQFDLVSQLPVIHNVLVGRLNEWGLGKSLLSFLFPQEKEVAQQALKKVGLLDKLHERTGSLSGGEQQRVALARILVQNPKVILADEPVSSLDPARAEDVISKLVELASENNQTLIASLHSVDLAKRHFSRIIALKEGKVYFDLPTDEVTDEQLTNLYTLAELKENE